jgi:hypothetical protein
VPGQGQVRLRPVEHQAEEEALLIAGAFQRHTPTAPSIDCLWTR